MKRIIIKYLFLILTISIASMTVSRLRTRQNEAAYHAEKTNQTRVVVLTQPSPQLAEQYDFLKRYPDLLKCKTDYNKWEPNLVEAINSSMYNYSLAAPAELQSSRITRALIVYFPIEEAKSFEYELRWLYRSWTHMMQYESSKWRTDLVVFIENNKTVFNQSDLFLNELDCRFENLRRSSEDKPMCTLLNYVALEKRDLGTKEKSFTSSEDLYAYLLKDVDIFKADYDEFDILRKLLKKEIGHYRYLNSILMAFEG